MSGAEPEQHFGADVLAPDLCGWRRERMPVYPGAPAIEVAPDWVCEILSPGTRRFGTTEKRDLWGANRASCSIREKDDVAIGNRH